jgi:uncharacterized protein
LVIAAIYLGLLLLLGLFLNGGFPPFGVTGLWFYSAFGALILGEFIIEPFFTRPADALANSIALILACAAVSLNGVEVSHEAASTGRLLYVLYGVALVGLAVVAISLKDRVDRLGSAAAWSARVVGRIGQARWVFSLLLFGAGFAAFADSAEKIAALYLSWVVIFVLAPLEFAWSGVRRREEQPPPRSGGIVERIEDPGVLVVRMAKGTSGRLGMEARIAGSEARGVVVDTTTLLDEPRVRVALPAGAAAAVGSSVVLSAGSDDQLPIVGFVGEGTTLSDLVIETAPMASDSGLEEGRLVTTQLRGRDVLYQVTEALVTGERTEVGSRDMIRVTARKLGIWNAEKTVFEHSPWVPTPGEPVHLIAAPDDKHFASGEIGHVPGTTYGVRVDLDLAVTHNTAVLGILGVGKTHLALELVKRMLCLGRKVVVLDITGQYSKHLDPVCGPDTEQAIAGDLRDRTSAHLHDTQVRNGEAGNLVEFQAALNELLTDFMGGEERLLVLNPNRFEVSRMEGRPFQGHANHMSRLSMVDITQMVAEGLLELVDDSFSEVARVCLVLEEAHSLIPEWNSTVNESERSAVNGTARALLQGRKYGLGCLVVTQRTANVTKSILNQCNTIFGMRVYDATGMGFLENYVGATHARLLASLPERQAVVFGRASSCNAPIILRLNDAEEFDQSFWSPCVGSVPVTQGPDVSDPIGAADPPAASTADDDIPF